MIFVFTDFALLVLFFLGILLILGQWDLPLICLPYSPLLRYCPACTIIFEYARLEEEFSTAKTRLYFSQHPPPGTPSPQTPSRAGGTLGRSCPLP